MEKNNKKVTNTKQNNELSLKEDYNSTQNWDIFTCSVEINKIKYNNCNIQVEDNYISLTILKIENKKEKIEKTYELQFISVVSIGINKQDNMINIIYQINNDVSFDTDDTCLFINVFPNKKEHLQEYFDCLMKKNSENECEDEDKINEDENSDELFTAENIDNI